MESKPSETSAQWRPGRRELLSHFARLGLGAISLSLISGCPEEQVLSGSPVTGKVAREPDPVDIRIGVQRISSGEAMDFVAGRYNCYLHRAQGDEWIAMSRRCTHSGCRISFQRDIQGYKCPCHGSAFDAYGKPMRGPAKLPLKRYQTRVDGDAVIVTFVEYTAPETAAPPATTPAPVQEDRPTRPPLPDISGQRNQPPGGGR